MHSTRLKDKPARGRDDDVTMTEPNFTRRPHTINKHVGNCSVAVLLRWLFKKKIDLKCDQLDLWIYSIGVTWFKVTRTKKHKNKNKKIKK